MNKKIRRFLIIFSSVFFLLILLGNIFLLKRIKIDYNTAYKVALTRIEQELRKENAEYLDENTIENIIRDFDIEILDILRLPRENVNESLSMYVEDVRDYYLFATDTYLYKIVYEKQSGSNTEVLVYFNVIMVMVFLVILWVFLHINRNILRPFDAIANLPYELAKGNLSIPLKENKSRYFGRFLWGMDLLREHLEESREKELALIKEKKLLILSLSHDIKTPLNAIALYARALSKNLYKDEKKQMEVVENIYAKVGEIESYMSDIVKASNEEFKAFDVKNEEVYISSVMSDIEAYYREKMELKQIHFEMIKDTEALVFADAERLIEVLQNLLENAIKYGDGDRIILEARKGAESYEILVRNTGCTLKTEELNHIFDSFYRGSNSEKQKGSGLGLFICKKLIHLMEGEILADILPTENGQMMEIRVILRYA